MARKMFPGDRTVYWPFNGFMRSVDLNGPVVVYVDSSPGVEPPVAVTLADIRNADGTSVSGSLKVNATSEMPLWQGPSDDTDTLVVTVNGGPPRRVYARSDDRLDALESAAASAGQKFTVTPTKTSGTYTASPWELVVGNPASSLTVNLPAANVAGQQVAVKNLATGVVVTVLPAGSDHINTAGTSSSVQLQDQVITYTSDGAGHWWISGGQKSVSSLDGRYGRFAEAYADVLQIADGTLTVLDTGQSVLNTHSSASGAALAVASGVLTNTSTVVGAAAGYAEVALTGQVGRVGCEFLFVGGTTTGGRLAITAFNPAINSTYPVIPQAACHVLVSTTGWTYGVWDPSAGSATVLASGSFNAPLAADGVTRYQVEVTFGTNKATLFLPDGSRAIVSDSRITSYMGIYAGWEVFLTAAATDARAGITAMWADPVTTGRRRLRDLSLRDLHPVVKEIARQAASTTRVLAYSPSSPGSTVAVPTSTGTIDATNLNMTGLLVPSSGAVLVELEGSLIGAGSGSVYWVANITGGVSVTPSVAVVESANFTGRARASFYASGLTPGASLSVLWRHLASGSGVSSFFVRGDNGHPAIMKVTYL